MPSYDFGSYGSGSRYTDVSPVYSDGIPMPGGRVCSDGIPRAGVTGVLVYSGGRYGGVGFQVTLGPSTSQYYSLGEVPTAVAIGPLPMPLFLVNGGSVRLSMYFSGGRIMFGGGGLGAIYNGNGSYWAGTLPGRIYYILPPEAPTISVTPSEDGTSVYIVTTGVGDHGEAAISGWAYQRADNAAFTVNVVTVVSAVPITMAGLGVGQQYFYRAASRNQLTDAAGVAGGAWSPTVARTQPDPNALGRQFRGSAFVPQDGRISTTGGWAFVEGRHWDGSTWKPLGR